MQRGKCFAPTVLSTPTCFGRSAEEEAATGVRAGSSDRLDAASWWGKAVALVWGACPVESWDCRRWHSGRATQRTMCHPMPPAFVGIVTEYEVEPVDVPPTVTAITLTAPRGQVSARRRLCSDNMQQYAVAAPGAGPALPVRVLCHGQPYLCCPSGFPSPARRPRLPSGSSPRCPPACPIPGPRSW